MIRSTTEPARSTVRTRQARRVANVSSRNAVISDPDDESARVYMIDYSIRIGKHDDAEYECRQWMAKSALDYRPVLSLAAIQRLRGKHAEALELARAALRTHEAYRQSPGFVDRRGYAGEIRAIWQELAFCHEALGESDRAADYNKKIMDWITSGGKM